ncbi:MAG: sugar transferase [Bryobacterales bacterium]|nr:sugar transferase [Bryobacterales bacterium]
MPAMGRRKKKQNRAPDPWPPGTMAAGEELPSAKQPSHAGPSEAALAETENRETPRVAVIVVTFNSRKHLADLTASLDAQTHGAINLVVVDSKSTDETREWLSQHRPDARVMASPRNLGYRNGNQLGMEMAWGSGSAPDYLLILNDDVELHPFAIERLVAAAEEDRQVSMAAPAILVHGHASRINAAGSSLLPVGFYSARGKDGDYEHYRKPGEIAAVSGCCFLYRAAAYRELGGFDAIFDTLPGGWHASAEDLDLCWRAWRAGHSVIYAPEAIVWHKYQQRPMHPSRFASLVAGRLAFLALNFPRRELLTLAPALLMTELALAAYSALRGFGFVRAWVNGYRWLWGNRRRIGELRGLRQARGLGGNRANREGNLVRLMQARIPLAPSALSNPLLRVWAWLWFGANAVAIGALCLVRGLPFSAAGAIKRTMDLAAALAMLVLLAPLLLAVAAAVRIHLGSPVFFRQTRIGWKERPFTLYKFRTMREGLDANGRALPDEARLTRFGSWLRALSFDEFPQLWNVVKGEMSLIGPRPLLPEYLPRYSALQRRRHDVRPGLSGWAQVRGRNSIDWERRFALDLEYIERQSLLFDLRIALMTLRKLVDREGISQPGRATMEEFRGAMIPVAEHQKR